MLPLSSIICKYEFPLLADDTQLYISALSDDVNPTDNLVIASTGSAAVKIGSKFSTVTWGQNRDYGSGWVGRLESMNIYKGRYPCCSCRNLTQAAAQSIPPWNMFPGKFANEINGQINVAYACLISCHSTGLVYTAFQIYLHVDCTSTNEYFYPLWSNLNLSNSSCCG